MSSERGAPFVSKPPDEWDSHVSLYRKTHVDKTATFFS